MTTLQRIGYGSSFNTLTRYKDTIKKESTTPYGHKKIRNEIDFYEYVRMHNIPIKLPEIRSSSKESNQYCMTYMDGYVPLYTLFPRFSSEKQEEILAAIRKSLSAMHEKTRRPVDRERLLADLKYEFCDKLLERYTELKPCLSEFDHIRRVNGLEVQSLETLVLALYTKVVAFFEKQAPEYCLIHGDCQFNNILIHPETQDIVFIDPRASFGKEGSLFGIKEYDDAKVAFALSGYDHFDNQTIDHLVLEGNNLILEDITLRKEHKTDIVRILVALIWLGNAQAFKSRPLKAAYSYFHAVHLATKSLYK
jgi:hypothetical protein